MADVRRTSSMDATADTDGITAPTAEEKEEYKRFLEEEAARAAAEEAARLSEAREELERSEHEKAYQAALSVISDTIARANTYNTMMSELAEKHLASLDLTRPPKLLTGGTLRDYQLTGFQWLVHKYLLSESGIIADEMGLGKTIQVISFISWMIEQHTYHPILIICPLTVVGNWIAEFKRFAPSIRTLRYTGPRDVREALQTDSSLFPKAAFGNATLAKPMPIIITSYQMAMSDADFLSRIQWRLLVLDEGHRIKNESCAFRRILTTYCPTARSGGMLTKVLLTGTPIQNDMTELWSLCNFVMPQVFRSKEEFMKIYRFIERGADINTQYYVKGEARRGIVTRLHTLLHRYILRRTKDEVQLSLPPKAEVLVYTPLSTEQVTLLKGIHNDSIVEAVRQIKWVPAAAVEDPEWDEPTQSTASYGLNTNNKQMQMRKICVHPFWIAEPRFAPGISCDERVVTSCGKLRVLDKMLTCLRAQGHKVLIFSQFKTVLDILQDYLAWRNSPAGVKWAVKQYGEQLFHNAAKEYSKRTESEHQANASAPPQISGVRTADVRFGEYRLLHGSIAAEERDAAIEEFNNDPDDKIFAFLLSTKAGGQGINLTAADTVIFYDSDWNPTSDAQAMDRAHRIGQTRPVVVYRMITEGASVERRIVRTAASKESLSRMILQEGMHKFSPSATLTPRGRAATSTAESPAEAGSYGRISEALLKYWLRDDVTDSLLIHGGIRDYELAIILDRARALQAGKRVTEEVEKELVTHMSEGTAPPAGSPTASDTATVPAPAPSVPTPARSGEKRKRAGRSAPAETASPMRSKSGLEHAPNHLALPPTVDPCEKVLMSAEAEQISWTAVASAAPFTASKGAAYEFVYHTTTGGLLSSKASAELVANAALEMGGIPHTVEEHVLVTDGTPAPPSVSPSPAKRPRRSTGAKGT